MVNCTKPTVKVEARAVHAIEDFVVTSHNPAAHPIKIINENSLHKPEEREGCMI